MEKADILEMTVAYLQAIYRCPPPGAAGSEPGGGRYAAGYRQCAVEVARYLAEVASRAAGDWQVCATMHRRLSIVFLPVRASPDIDVKNVQIKIKNVKKR